MTSIRTDRDGQYEKGKKVPSGFEEVESEESQGHKTATKHEQAWETNKTTL